MPRKLIGFLEAQIKVKFPLANGNPDTAASAENVSYAIGYLNSRYSKLTPLIDLSTFGDFFYPELGYLVTLSAPDLMQPPGVYQGDNDARAQARLSLVMQDNLKTYFKSIGVVVTDAVIKDESDQMAKLESSLAKVI